MAYQYRPSKPPRRPIPWRYLWLALAVLVILILIKGRLGRNQTTKTTVDPTTFNYTVFLQPGGGGDELNNQYPSSGKPELTGMGLNLKLAKVVKEVLAKEGVNGVLSRESDTSFVDAVDRSQRAESLKAGLSLSFYTGWNDDTTVRGWQLIDYKRPTWDDNYRQRVTLARQLEKSLQQRLASFKVPGRTVVTRNSILAPDMPTMVVVWGELSNETDRGLMQSDDYLYAVANAVTDAVVEYRDRISSLTETPAGLAPEEVASDIFLPY